MLRYPEWTSVLIFGLLLLTLNTAVAQQRRTALVIGNATYKDSPLTNPVNDANDMAAALKRLGFEVIIIRNANLQTMEENIEAFSLKLRQGGMGLFYYAGHGVQIDGENYLIPVGELISSQVQARSRSVAVGTVLGALRDARNELNVVILDACRNNPLPKSDRSFQRGLAMPTSQTRGTLIAYATSPGETASDGNSRNGIYTQYLLKHITTPGLKVEDVFKKVRVDVEKSTQGGQLPWELSSLSGDFYFSSSGSVSSSGAASTPSVSAPSPSASATPSGLASPSSANPPQIKPLSNVPAASAPPPAGPQVAALPHAAPPSAPASPTAKQFPGWSNSLGMEFVLIPAGEFIMGADNGKPEEKPAHKVIISRPFYLGKYEVTQGQWQSIMNTNPSHFRGKKEPRLPVEHVSWLMAQEFIQKLNAKEGHTQYRLPTEAEWEYAARAGSTTTYSFGNDEASIGQYAWCGKVSKNATYPGGGLSPNAWGLYDMFGNVAEWVSDWHGPYPSGTVTDPQGVQIGKLRIYRGGDWRSTTEQCRSADRVFQAPSYHYGTIGFRVAITAQ
jgi:formylglycine-generating enzyme required for sulfatase activity